MLQAGEHSLSSVTPRLGDNVFTRRGGMALDGLVISIDLQEPERVMIVWTVDAPTSAQVSSEKKDLFSAWDISLLIPDGPGRWVIADDAHSLSVIR